MGLGRTFKQANDTERRLVKNTMKENLTWAKIQRITRRTPYTLRSIVKSRIRSSKKSGAAKKIPDIPGKVLPKVLRATERLQKKAKAEKEVTADMIIKEAGLKAYRETLQKTFHKSKTWFYKLKEKPALTPDDIVSRFAWAGDHMKSKRMREPGVKEWPLRCNLVCGEHRVAT